MRTPISMLDLVHVATPCSMNWEGMAGDDRSRFCHECRLHVFNLSSMPRAEAEALILEKQGRLCVRYYRREDGRILTQDCPVGIRQRIYRRVGLMVGLFVGFVLGAQSVASTFADGGASPGGSRLVDREPFRTIYAWLVPPAPPPPTLPPPTMGLPVPLP